ncbi:hypothetical protein Sango_0683200 [Sesamum angolense]|uniref:Small ribosomal subunit protein mS41 SAM domain-containing protein n=1 Tax=Sesamum angolense TaxID=2727404 RepID=A0AAE1X8E8_9LAMI|nr:hypothetical protein Sango_0683200 [Sesamum angolense]
MAWRQILSWSRRLSSVPAHSNPVSGIAKFSSKSGHYVVKVGIPEFLIGVGKGLEKHVEKLESEIGGLEKLLVTRTIKLKRLGIPCQDSGGSPVFLYMNFGLCVVISFDCF